MNKPLLSLALLTLGTLSLKAQTIVNDSVMIGSANESWYKLSDGTRTTQARANWELGFTTDGYEVTVLFNHAAGNNVYIATGATPATFTAVTQADAATTPLYNSDSTWTLGALNQQPVGSYNYGWGSYNPSTHNITGNRVFIAQLSGGAYKKFYIQDLTNSGTPYIYTLVYSDIDNSNLHTVTIPKQTYGTKNFIYYSLTTDAIVDREPASADWDLLFTKYTSTSELYQGSANQVVAGVIQNMDVLAAQANSVAAPSTYTTYAAHTFSTATNVLGWDWKGLNASFQYTVEPARVYFVKTRDNTIYKIVFTSYTGSTSGKFKFTKEVLQTSTSVNEVGATISAMALYPNPANGDHTTLLFSTTGQVSNVSVSVTDITGKLLYTEQLVMTSGLNQHHLYTGGFNTGVYFVSINAGGYSTTQKLIKQ
ncbi:MAG: T9SS type A sorting domain-containing protein [Bacteroidetes bacterium]|nr:T9SS type A sorting domain-containing protein [Bacteroidota bacterium]